MHGLVDTPSTENLLKRAQAGDREALEALLVAVQPQLYRFSMKMCRHTEDAEDVLQDSMLSVARALKDFRGGSSLSTWAFTIARRFCIKKRRQRRYAPKQEESLEHLKPAEKEGLSSSVPNPEEQVEATEVWQQVQVAISALDPAYREILVLRDIEGLTAKEVASVVGLSVSAVKSRLHRARGQLRASLTGTDTRSNPACPDIRKIFSEHLEGDLSPDICATMQAHVSACTACARECDGLKAVLNACSTAPCEVPAGVQEQVKRALRAVMD